MIVVIVVGVSAWLLVKGLSRKDGGTYKTTPSTVWTAEIEELEDFDKDIIFRVEVLFKEIGGESSSEKEVYLELLVSSSDMEAGEWVFQSLKGPLKSESGTCTVKSGRGSHTVRLKVDSKKLSQGGIYPGLPPENQFEVKFLDKIEGKDDVAKKVAELSGKEDQQMWDLMAIGERRGSLFDVGIGGINHHGQRRYDLEFDHRQHDGFYLFKVHVPKDQLFDECPITGITSDYNSLHLLIHQKDIQGRKQVVARATYVAWCTKHDGKKAEYKIRFYSKY